MAFQVLTVSAGWPAAPHFTSGIDQEILLVNPNAQDEAALRWIWTDDDTVPTVDPALCAPLAVGARDKFELRFFHRLWIAAPKLGSGTVPATLVTGVS